MNRHMFLWLAISGN